MKKWIKLHKKGLTISIALSIFLGGFAIGASFSDLWYDMFAGGDTTMTIATYSTIAGVSLLAFLGWYFIWLKGGFATRRALKQQGKANSKLKDKDTLTKEEAKQYELKLAHYKALEAKYKDKLYKKETSQDAPIVEEKKEEVKS